MKRLPWCFALLMIIMPASADPLNDSDRELLLERLTKIKEAAEGRVDNRIALAVAAFRPAMSSNEAAIELYLKCVEKLDFEDQNRKSQDFREWKRRQKAQLDDPGLRLALRLQLQWLVYTLEVVEKPAKLATMGPKASAALEAIFANGESLSRHHDVLRQGVTSSVFARVYNVSNVETGDWPTAPLAFDRIYEKVILPPLRHPNSLEQLRAAWLTRIAQEAKSREAGTGGNGNGRSGMREEARTPAFEKFITDERPDLIWQMEEDLFKAGDQRGAALRMLDHLERYLSHPKAPDWAAGFIKLISPPPPAGTPGSPSADPPRPTDP